MSPSDVLVGETQFEIHTAWEERNWKVGLGRVAFYVLALVHLVSGRPFAGTFASLLWMGIVPACVLRREGGGVGETMDWLVTGTNGRSLNHVLHSNSAPLTRSL